MKPSTRLSRNPANGRVAGVAAGLSDFFGIDVRLIRILLVLGTLFSSGIVPIIYVLGWVLIPVDPARTGPVRTPTRRSLGWSLFTVILVFVAINTLHGGSSAVVAPIVAASAFAITFLIYRKVRGSSSWRTRKEFEQARLAWQRRLDEQANQARQPTNLGGDAFRIDSFYPTTPPDEGNQPQDNPNSGFQTQ